MKIHMILATVTCALATAAAPARAQSLLMNSAETIDKGNFKLAGFPAVLFGEDDAPDSWGFFSRFGYGFTDRFDVEGKVGFFEGFNLYGADAELWLVKGPVDFSVTAGGHFTDADGGSDSKAFDAAVLASGNLTSRLELYGGLSLSFESLDDSDESFTRTYLVPGVEYRISDSVDFLTEVGIGLGDDSPSYVSAGVAFYVR